MILSRPEWRRLSRPIPPGVPHGAAQLTTRALFVRARRSFAGRRNGQSVLDRAATLEALRYRYSWPAGCALRGFFLDAGPEGRAALEVFLDAVERQADQTSALRYLIIGSGSTVEAAAMLLARRRLRGRVGVLGYCGPRDPRRIACGLDHLAHLSVRSLGAQQAALSR